jgi:hypothetical protein
MYTPSGLVICVAQTKQTVLSLELRRRRGLHALLPRNTQTSLHLSGWFW